LVSWDSAAGATTYELEVSAGDDFSTLAFSADGIAATGLQVDSLEFETTYFWRVRGVNAAGAGAWSPVWGFTTEAEPLSPPAMVNLSSPADAAVGVSVAPLVSWDSAAGATTYELEVSAGDDFSTLAFSADGIAATGLQVDSLEFETMYFWRVRGVNAAGAGAWSPVWGFTTEADFLETPLNFTISAENALPKLSWTASSTQGDQFNIYRGVSPRQLVLIDSVSSGEFTYLDNQIPEGIFFYAITNASSSGNESSKTASLSFVNVLINADENWNLISLPADLLSVETELATLYRFDRSYVRENSIEPLNGYWIKSRSFNTENYQIRALGILSSEINLDKGWNLIGSLTDSVHISDIEDPAGILSSVPVFVYEQNNYVATEYLLPGYGHWIFAEKEGKIKFAVKNDLQKNELAFISSNVTQKDNVFSNKILTKEAKLPQLKISNSKSSAYLTFGNNISDKDEIQAFYLPPVAPEAVLDVRSGNNSSLIQSANEKVYVLSSNYPLRVSIENAKAHKYYRLKFFSKAKEVFTLDLEPEKQRIINTEFEYFTLKEIEKDQLIKQDQLINNYPNPFNPETTIQFQLSKTSKVKLEVFDIIGRRVRVLTNDVLQTGRYTVIFNASNLSSGTYLVRFQTQRTVNVSKITLLK